MKNFMKKRLLTAVLMLSMILSIAPLTVSAEVNINIGDYLQMGTYYGEPILWRCVDIDENGPLILSDKIICIKPFDARTSTGKGVTSHLRHGKIGSTNSRDLRGSNYWQDSNIRVWLNSDASEGNIEWIYGNPPKENYVYLDCNEYDQEAGFLSNFSQNEKNAIKTVTQKSIVSTLEYENGIYDSGSEGYSSNMSVASVAENYDIAYSEQVTDKIFLLDVKQLSAVYNNSNVLGEGYYIGEPTLKAIENNEYKKSSASVGKKFNYWLRTPLPRDKDGVGVYYVAHNGGVVSYHAYYSDIGVRPAFYLNSYVTGAGTESDPFRISGSNSAVTSYGSAVSQWSSPEMEEAYKMGLVPTNLVGEDLTVPVTRAEFAAISVKLYETLTGTSTSSGNTPFVDISANANKSDIEKAYALNIAVGVSDNEFAPNDGLTREQLATMLCRTIKKYKFAGWSMATDSEYYLDSEGVRKFADDDLISDYAKPSVYYMVKMGIISGVDESHFAPRNTTDEEEANGYASATREQAIALSLRIYKLSDLWK